MKDYLLSQTSDLIMDIILLPYEKEVNWSDKEERMIVNEHLEVERRRQDRLEAGRFEDRRQFRQNSREYNRKLSRANAIKGYLIIRERNADLKVAMQACKDHLLKIDGYVISFSDREDIQ